MPPTLTPEEVAAHNTLNDLWLVIDHTVYDFTDFVREHPGGIAVILRSAGKDATEIYSEVHGPNLVKSTIPASHCKGFVAPGAMADPARQQPLPRARSSSVTEKTIKEEAALEAPPVPSKPTLSKPALDTLISAHDFEAAASTSFSPKAWAFVSSAATDLYTKQRNASAYSQIGLRPRVLVDVSSVDTATSMLGNRMRSPIFCPPTAMARLVHPEGEKELGRGCKAAGIPQCVSVSASFPLNEILSAHEAYSSPGQEEPYKVPVFFQLYVDKNRANSERILRSAQAQGVKALFLTIDAPIPGKREADERVRSDESLGSPISGAKAVNDSKGGALGRIMGSYIDASVNWSDIAWLRRTVPGLPVILKGVQTWMDAERAVDAGVEAIVLSNHGGRSLDTSPATIMVLLELQKNCPHVFDKVEVYVDGGISRGTDIFKALCLGAKAVGVGRGLLYGLNYGAEGVARYIEILRDELETTMKMCGVTSLDQVHPGFLNTLGVCCVAGLLIHMQCLPYVVCTFPTTPQTFFDIDLHLHFTLITLHILSLLWAFLTGSSPEITISPENKHSAESLISPSIMEDQLAAKTGRKETATNSTASASSHTSATVDSDSDASSAMTLVDLFPDPEALSDDGPGDTSASSTEVTSSGADSSDAESSDAKGKTNAEKKGMNSESESESAESNISNEASSDEAVASTTSGEASSNETDDASSQSAKASSSSQGSNHGNFTASEDALILSMKGGGESWAGIASVLHRGKNEIKKRWHVLKADQANSAESAAESEGEPAAASRSDTAAESTEEDTKHLSRAERKQQRKAAAKEEKRVTSESEKAPETETTVESLEGESKYESKAERRQKRKAAAKAQKQQQQETKTVQTDDPKPKKNKTIVVEQPGAVASSDAPDDEQDADDEASNSSYRARLNLLRDTSSASESSSSATSGGDDSPDTPGYYERERARQARYIRRHVHPALYPSTVAAAAADLGGRTPSPADKKQRRDDAILASVASRREATRWLEMQANFFNVTGRMIPLHSIKTRCEAAEGRGKAAGVRSWASSVAGSDELLDPEQSGDVPDDALVGNDAADEDDEDDEYDDDGDS
ncbi:Cytochrome b2 [Colletotrichum orbiculare MAFF 240422]|uniref:L-lactate dehydrogenase (cytochrome) n=1 Tax=Colletotrichum orbiculare (strain 104-T / ATCC 96160 / CBS 514.97 / LARS 414 / MAFF 240422) TaxID=1213857 RepID=A0A484FX62_COLOR|nr:Cytochrome b2 [Colletotrichum orbiculare MAFF 240422]